MLPVTVVIPIKNDEAHLRKCLPRLSDFETILLVDSNSSDDSLAVAKEHNTEVLQFSWNGQFPKKRNWVLRNYDFKTEWVLFLDADEYLTETFVSELQKELPGSKHDGYWLNYQQFFMTKALRHGDQSKKLALFRIGTTEYEKIEEDSWSSLDMEIHEHPILNDSQVAEVKSKIEHHNDRGIHAYIERHNEYSSWEAKRYLKLKKDKISLEKLSERQKKKYQCLGNCFAAPAYFLRSYILKLGFLDGAAGFHFALLKGIYYYQIRLKLKEIEGNISSNKE